MIKFDSADEWSEFKEVVPIFEETTLRSNSLLEHMNTTKDRSDYLWYTVSVDSSETQPVLSVDSLGHVLHAFINGAPAGSAHGTHNNSSFTLESNINLSQGLNSISLLSATVGLPDSGAYLERRALGLQRVTIEDKQGTRDLSNSSWGYQVGLLGEISQIYAMEGSSAAQWSKFVASPQPLTWYKILFDAPEGDDPLALNLGSMGKGEAWINGQSIGRYWVSFLTADGYPSQTWYRIPRSFLQQAGNQLVLFEEEAGNPLQITIGSVSRNKACGLVSDSNMSLVNSWKKHEINS